MIVKEKWIFSTGTRIFGVFLLIVLGAIINFSGGEKSLESSNQTIVTLTLLVFGLLALFVGLGKAKITIHQSDRRMVIQMGLLGLPLFKEEKKLPAVVTKVLIYKESNAFKKFTSFFTGKQDQIYNYTVFLLNSKGRPIRLMALEQEQELGIIRELARVESAPMEIIDRGKPA